MARVNKAAWINAREVLTPSRRLERACVKLEGGSISGVGEWVSDPDFEGQLLIPGMLDLHINGTRGDDAAEGSEEVLAHIARAQAGDGVTGFLPTLISDREEPLTASLKRLSGVLHASEGGARALGIHLEGPFLSPERRGAHRPEALQTPSVEGFERYVEASRRRIVKLTLAPELPGALEVIAHARRRLPVVSMGHSTADFVTAQKAIEAGANAATHIFNAMDLIHHRKPGLPAAALLSEHVTAQFIGDGVHVHPEMLRILFRCKGADGLCLVTDAVSAAGMPDGDYLVGSVTVQLRNGVCRDAEGRLAGSALLMDQALRNLADWLGPPAGLPLKDLVATATLNPARLLGLEKKGRIEPGADADLVLLDRGLRVEKTWVEGVLVHDVENRR